MTKPSQFRIPPTEKARLAEIALNFPSTTAALLHCINHTYANTAPPPEHECDPNDSGCQHHADLLAELSRPLPSRAMVDFQTAIFERIAGIRPPTDDLAGC